nr:EOG090X0ALT [Ceriodaphnia reticulata]
MAACVQTSSFQKRTKPSSSSIVGTKISAVNSTLHVSSGIPSLDNISDGGLPLGSLCLIEEDIYGSYAKMITKYFLAEGAVHKNYLFAASLNENPWDILNNLPSPVTEVRDTTKTENKEELKIAWRYENLSLDYSNEKTGNAFDLSLPYIIPESTIQNAYCLSLLNAVDECIEKWKLDRDSSNLLRIVVSSFGSPYWQFDEKNLADITASFLVLKSLIRSSNAIAVLTIPHQLMNVNMVARSRSTVDWVIQLKSLREDPHLHDLMDVHGILEMKKMANLTSLKPILGQDGTTTYGFKATKRKFKIEKLHLPPAIEDEKSTPGGDQTASLGCASNSFKSNLDF